MLENACAQRGCGITFRGPNVLWRLLRGEDDSQSMPTGCTWQRLCAAYGIDDLVRARQLVGAGVAPAATAVGTATHVLTSNGAGVAPTFQALPASGLTRAQVTTIAMLFSI